MTWRMLVAFALLSILAPTRVHAFDNRAAGIALHITEANSRPPASACAIPLMSTTIQTQVPFNSENGEFFWTYLLVCDGSDSTGIAGMEMGIWYTRSIQVYNWALCADLQFPDGIWPGSNGSNVLTWTLAHCQNTPTYPAVRYSVIAIGGYFYMGAYGPSQMAVIPRPASGRAKVADCSSREDDLTFTVPSKLGAAGFAGPAGYNPCGVVLPVEPTTWSDIKSRDLR